MSDHYELARMPITTDRWHTHYGWSEHEAQEFGDSSWEVRIFACSESYRRELEADTAGTFEFGYGGSGPHDAARAILADRGVDLTQWSPADLRTFLPEVFERDDDRGYTTLSIPTADIDRRLSLVGIQVQS